MPSLLSRLHRAWRVLIGAVETEARGIYYEIDGNLAEIRTRIEKINFALTLKEIPMAIIDEINKLSADIDAALAAKDQAVVQTVADLAAAGNTIADLNAQLDAASAAVVALQGKLEPVPGAASDSTVATA